MLRYSLLLLLLSLVAMDIAWSKGRKDVMNKKQLTAEVKNIQQKLASREPVVLEDNRLLVFRLTAGNNKVAYDAYTDVGNNDDEGYRANVRCGCLTVNGSLPCETHYRSRLLDHWPSSVIDTVRVSVYENDEEKAFVEFDGEGSTYLDWWSADRVVASSWADLLTQKRFETQSGAFSIAGRDDRRQFYIPYADLIGCDDVAGWLAVVDSEEHVCAWGRNAPLPLILYSKQTSNVLWNSNDVGRADVLTITVKLKDGVSLDQCTP